MCTISEYIETVRLRNQSKFFILWWLYNEKSNVLQMRELYMHFKRTHSVEPLMTLISSLFTTNCIHDWNIYVMKSHYNKRDGIIIYNNIKMLKCYKSLIVHLVKFSIVCYLFLPLSTTIRSDYLFRIVWLHLLLYAPFCMKFFCKNMCNSAFWLPYMIFINKHWYNEWMRKQTSTILL